MGVLINENKGGKDLKFGYMYNNVDITSETYEHI